MVSGMNDHAPDPAVNYARALASMIAAARDLLDDDAFAAKLPLFEELRLAIPDPLAAEVPCPRPASPAVELEPHPLDR